MTSGLAWLDTPPAGKLHFYRVMGPCLIPSTEICDGVDDDCNGLIDDGCPGSCTDDLGCAVSEFCDATGRCAPDRADGQACTRSEQCAANHCANGICCAGGDCCVSGASCGAYGWALRCDDAASCQGSTAVGVCGPSYQCGSQVTENDSACAGLVSQQCGPYPAASCTASATQPPDQSALCPTVCIDDGGCDPNAHCDASACILDSLPGGVCDAPGDCQSGFCVDGVCCTSACTGTCAACDVAGSMGTCVNLPTGTDPDAECGALSCAGYYWGWVGDACYPKADATAAQAACNGTGACRTAAVECTAQSSAGPPTLICQPTCQDPNLTTCAGTVPGLCTNVNPGTQTCGVGPCTRTTNQCKIGAPVTCVPGTPTSETCNNVDDDCDGVVDNGLSPDTYELNNDCAHYRTLPTVNSDATITLNTLTLYPSGDIDYFRINAAETDSSCACCDFVCTDEDYRLRVSLTVPVGGGSYEYCLYLLGCLGVPSCQMVNEGATGSWNLNLDGGCPGNDSYSVYVRIDPGTTLPGFECVPYTLSYFFDALVCN